MAHEHINQNRYTDSAGVPWQGRSFEENPFSDDDGSASPGLVQSILDFQSSGNPAQVFLELQTSRLLIPLIANLGESEIGAHGHQVDKSAELSIVTVKSPDGANALPVFSSVAAMSKWNPQARPVPADAVRVALAAASEGNTRVVLDPTSDTEYVLRRPAIAALAQSKPWVAPHLNSELLELLSIATQANASVKSCSFTTGDPLSRLQGPELVVKLGFRPGLTPEELQLQVQQITSRWAQIADFGDYVDELKIVIEPVS